MSELIQKHDNRATIRWKLLTGASALALTAYVSSAVIAKADDASRPTLWIELGGQLDRLQDGQEIYAPPFVALTPAPFSPPQKAERPPLYGLDESAKISFQPDNSDWIFSASIHYGRAGSRKHVRQQSDPAYATGYVKFHRSSAGHYFAHTNYYFSKPIADRFTDAVVKQSERHTIVDFQAGKDLGIGLFGHDASSSLNVGVRFAQFTSKSRVSLKEDPDWQFKSHLTTFSTAYDYNGYYYTRYLKRDVFHQPYHTFSGTFRAQRNFRGLGPSISWNSSLPFAGNSQDGELTLDWGVNAALLFGRQKVKAHHQTTARYSSGYYGGPVHVPVYNHNPPSRISSRNITVPNVGAFAGISFDYSTAKVSFGYKADMFFNAIDGGIDTRKNENRAFYGPYASISIGLGSE